MRCSNFLKNSKINMNIKYRQAIANLAKQAHVVKVKQVDPLSAICATRIQAVKKTKFIQKKNNGHNIKKQVKSSKANQGSKNQQLQRLMKAKQRRNKPKQTIDIIDERHWEKYLPQQCDQFQQNEQANKNISNQTPASNPKQQPQTDSAKPNQVMQDQKINLLKQGIATQPSSQSSEYQQFDPNNFDIEALKLKLGIKVIQEEVKKVEEPVKQLPPDLKDSKNTALLPFIGRVFQQAPPKPEPKKIHEYPPTCKIAGIYPWPPPQSQYRKWKNHMKQARKLK